MSRAAKRLVLVDHPTPSPAQVIHVERLRAEGYEVELIPSRPGERIDFALAYTLATQERIDQARERLRPNTKTNRPTNVEPKE
jgi:hypothetical protein